ncbi:hypothetical protein Taro_023936 [Colocasia esculenta]|uniref:Uncharacterized protein n=1 Tax=Colocasia esculenta TaxID=4460 RepID=A0A843VFY4_COLES|nr:hypothetical protein [Colocasia esculenta]
MRNVHGGKPPVDVKSSDEFWDYGGHDLIRGEKSNGHYCHKSKPSAVSAKQGFKWYGERLKVDEDGDVADEFLYEVLLPEEAPRLDTCEARPVFKIRHGAQPAAVRNQVMVAEGSVRHSVEHRGRLRWV